MKKSEFIKRAWSFIDERRKWITGAEKSGDTYCSIGAMKAAHRAFLAEGVDVSEMRRIYNEVQRELELDVNMPVIHYNDSHNYTAVAAWWKRVMDKISKEETPEITVELKEQQPRVVRVTAEEKPVAEKKKELA